MTTPRGRSGGGGRGESKGQSRSRNRYAPRRACALCANKGLVINYKNPGSLRPFVSERAKIDSRRRTGTCAKHQRLVAREIKRARHLALLPFTPDHIQMTGGVGLKG
ncbi:MAG: 30S ribosomal protein S18 [Chloroflexota bacterium]